MNKPTRDEWIEINSKICFFFQIQNIESDELYEDKSDFDKIQWMQRSIFTRVRMRKKIERDVLFKRDADHGASLDIF